MANIGEYLKNILSARYGRDVRQSIHDAIQQCYYDGQAGEIDLQARQDIEVLEENLANVESIAKGKNRARVFSTTEAMNAWLSDANNKGVAMKGDNLYIVALDVPDWWIAEVLEEPNENGMYYEIALLETQKVDLTEIESEIDKLNGSLENFAWNLVTEESGIYTQVESGYVATEDCAIQVNIITGSTMNSSGAVFVNGTLTLVRQSNITNSPFTTTDLLRLQKGDVITARETYGATVGLYLRPRAN